MSIVSFNPPVRTLMGPGPSDVHPRVTSAMARPCIGQEFIVVCPSGFAFTNAFN